MKKQIPFQYDVELKREIILRGLNHKTFKNYRSQLRRISEYFSKDILDISASEVKQYLYHLHSLGRCPQVLNVCRAAFYFLNQNVFGRELS